MEDMKKREMVTVEVLVMAPLSKVWKYWTEPYHITKWYFASDTWCAPYAKNDLQVGGHFLIRMEAKDGSFGFDLEGDYTLLEAEKRMHYVLPDGREVEIQFSETAEGVLVTERFHVETQNPVELQRNGWQAILDNFKKHTENE